MVYFLLDNSIGDNRIKIGFTRDDRPVTERMREVSDKFNVRELIFMAAIPNADFRMERELHRKFSSLLIGREWFRNEPELTSFIQSVLDEYPIPVGERHRVTQLRERISREVWTPPPLTPEQIAKQEERRAYLKQKECERWEHERQSREIAMSIERMKKLRARYAGLKPDNARGRFRPIPMPKPRWAVERDAKMDARREKIREFNRRWCPHDSPCDPLLCPVPRLKGEPTTFVWNGPRIEELLRCINDATGATNPNAPAHIRTVNEGPPLPPARKPKRAREYHDFENMTAEEAKRAFRDL